MRRPLNQGWAAFCAISKQNLLRTWPAPGPKLFAAYLQNYEQAWTAFPDAAPMLDLLRANGIPAAVVTNGNHDQQTSKIKRIALEPLLDGAFSSELMGHTKPEPEAFLVPCRSMDVLPAETLYVGDNYLTDITGARNAGLRAVHLDRDATGLQGAIQTLTDLSDLRRWDVDGNFLD